MANWQREPQEREGSYFFSGQFYVTRGVADELPLAEIIGIYRDLQQLVRERNGIDYLQVYTDEAGRKLYLIDQLDAEMLQSSHCQPEDNYCTLMFAHEY